MNDGADRVLLHADGHHIVQAVNSVVAIVGGERRTLLERPSRLRTPLTASATRLVRAASTPVPFVDVTGALSDLLDWIGWDDAFAVRIIGGRGGAGKTRLALQACQDVADSTVVEWLTGLLPAESGLAEVEALAVLPLPRLVVVDYAETRVGQVSRLLGMLAVSATAAAPVRVLLLVRRPAPARAGAASGGSAWVDAVRGNDDAADILLDQATETILDDREFGPAERAALLDAAFTAFAPASSARWGDLDAPMFALPLMVVMAGFLAARDQGVPLSRAGIFDAVLMHEERYWSSTWNRADLPLAAVAHREAVALATLTGTSTVDEGIDLLGLVPEFEDRPRRERGAVEEWLSRLYPPMPGSPHPHRWGPLEPDTLGEYLVATHLSTNHGIIAAVVDPVRPPVLLTRPLTVLTRVCAGDAAAATAVADVVAANLLELVRATIAEANDAERYRANQIVTPDALAGLVTVLTPHLPAGIVSTCEQAIPAGHPVLAPLGVALSTCAIAGYRALAAEDSSHIPGLAMALNNHAIALSDVGRREEAVLAAEEAVTLFRALAQASPEAYTPNLAKALTNVGIRLSEVGSREEAVAAAEEAVPLWRVLAEGSPAAYSPNLAMALNNLGNGLYEVRRREEAMVAVEEALTLWRVLAQASPTAYTSDLAGTLSNLGRGLSKAGRREEAAVAAEEAVGLFRVLAEASPAAYTPDLAGALTNVGILLSGVGRRAEAVVAAEEAVGLYRVLAEASPAAYTPDLAGALTNLGNRLSEVGRRAEAVVAGEEAVGLYRVLAEASPAAYTPDLAGALTNLGNRLSEVGRRAEAVVAGEDAVGLYRVLAEASPAAYTPDLAMALTDVEILLSEVGRLEEAAVAAEEAAGLWRVLAEAGPAAYTPNLAMALTDVGVLLSEVGRGEEAAVAAEEAAGLWRVLAEARPAAYTPHLAMALNNVGVLLSEVGRGEEAMVAAEEAVALYRVLAEAGPAAHTPDLAGALNNLGRLLFGIEDEDGAAAAFEEARNLSRLSE